MLVGEESLVVEEGDLLTNMRAGLDTRIYKSSS